MPYSRLAKPLPLTEPLKPRTVKSSDWSLNLSKVSEKSIGVFAHIVNILSAEGGASTSQVEVLKRRGVVLETQCFEISEDPAYVESTSRVSAVQKELKKIRSSGKTLYLVTGIKIVRWPGEAVHEQTDSAVAEGKAAAVLDPDGQVEAGFGANTCTSDETAITETPETAYVVAYRLRRLRVNWIRRRLKLRNEQSGAEMSSASQWRTDSGDSSSDEDDADDWEVEDVTADVQDFGPSLPGKNNKLEAVDEDDGSACLVIQSA